MSLTVVDQGLLSSTAQYTAFKNRIINGAMGIWQRGTSGFTTGYNADRWCQVNGTISGISQSSDVPSGYKYSLSMIGSSTPGIGQRIESVNCTDLVGQNITISFWAKQSSGAGSGSIALNLYYANSSDNFASITQIGSGQSFTGTSGWVQYTATFTALPSGAANGLGVYLYSSVSGSSTTLITGIQLEKGSTATSFDYRPYGTELALCQRYYWKSPNTSIGGLGFCFGAAASNYGRMQIALPVQMRSAPTAVINDIGLYNPAYTNGSASNITASYSTPNLISVDGSATASLQSGAIYLVYFNSSSSYVTASSEL